MTGAPLKSSTDLAPECQTLTRYLAGLEATPYVLDKYHAGHECLLAALGTPPTWFDGVLLALARYGSLGAGLADTYSRWFARHSLVRHKIVLLLAVLEHSPGYYEPVTTARTGAPSAILGAVTLAGIREFAVLLVSIVVIGPIHLFAAITRIGH